MITLTGCMKEYSLSETQTDVVAEYMASRLLEKDKVFTPSLLTYNEVIDLDEVILTDEPETEDTNDVPQNNNNNDIFTQDSSFNSKYTLSEVIAESDFDIQYISYQLADTYPEDESNLVFSLDPRAGYQLLVVNFSIENITDSDKIIELSSAKIQYQLDINVGTIYVPQFALLENNLKYIDMNVKTGDKIPAVLIFEVKKDVDMSDINLIVSRKDKTEIIEIK